MDRFLIWGIAFGTRAQSLAPLWISALRLVARWDQDIVLLGDSGVENVNMLGVRPINVARDIQRRYGIAAKRFFPMRTHNFKSEIVHHVDVAAYKYLLYLDIDVLANSPRLAGLVSTKAALGKISVQEDTQPLGEKRLAALAAIGLATEDEKRTWGIRPICSGMMGFPTSSHGLRALGEFHEACRLSDFRGSDQAKLTAILHRGYSGHWDFLDDATHGSSADSPYTETLVHFPGQRDDLLRDYYRRNLEPIVTSSASPQCEDNNVTARPMSLLSRFFRRAPS